MIIIDTNIITEMMKLTPEKNVIQWLDAQSTVNLFITTISIAEISYGIHNLPEGKKRDALEDIFYQSIHTAFKQRILQFDEESAFSYGKLMWKRQKIGRPMSVPDGQIAAIAYVHHATLATRNISDFEYCEINITNPFDA